MEVFNLTLNQMLLMFVLIVAGFILRKKNIMSENSYVALSKLEVYLLSPALLLYTQITKCNIVSLKENWVLILYGFSIVLLSMALSYPLSRLFVRNASHSSALAYQRNIYKYAMTFGNFGFMGNFIILSVFGNDMLFKYSLFSLGVSVMCYSWGLFILIPKEENASTWAKLKKGLLTPQLIAIVVGIIVGILGVGPYIPRFLLNALESSGDCMGPVAMVLAGLVVGNYGIKELITNKKIYIASVLRLIILPAIFILILKALGTAEEIVVLTLFCFATPLGLNTVVYPAAYGGDTKTGAAMAVISHILSVITIPLMYFLFVTIL